MDTINQTKRNKTLKLKLVFTSKMETNSKTQAGIYQTNKNNKLLNLGQYLLTGKHQDL